MIELWCLRPFAPSYWRHCRTCDVIWFDPSDAHCWLCGSDSDFDGIPMRVGPFSVGTTLDDLTECDS